MPYEGVAVRELRQRFTEEFLLNCYSVTELDERFNIAPKTAHKRINRFREHGLAGLEELSRRPHS